MSVTVWPALVCLSLAAVLLAGCGRTPAEVPETAGPTQTAAASPTTPAPTASPTTPAPSATPPATPTAIPTPEASPTPEPTATVARPKVWAAGEPVELAGGNGPVYSLDWSPDGTLLASAGYGQVQLWQGPDWQAHATLTGRPGYIWAVAWSPDGKWLAAGGDDGTVQLWAAPDFARQESLNAGWVFSLAWSPDGERLAAGTSSGRVSIWDTSTWVELATLRGNSQLISLGWSPDGALIAAGQLDGTLRVWDTRSEEEILTLVGSQGRSDVNGLSWSPDGRTLAVAQQDSRVRLWNMETGHLAGTLRRHLNWVRGLEWSPDGTLLASGGMDTTVRVWHPASGRELLELDGGRQPVWVVAWSPDGQMLAAGNGPYNAREPAGVVRIWTLESGPPYEVAVTRDLAYNPAGDATQRADLYRPENAAGPWPVVLALHGGYGDKRDMAALAEYLAGQGYAVVAANFRDMPQHPYPAAAEDVFCAWAWIQASATELDLDPERVVALGHSSGGTLAALLGAVDDRALFAADCPYDLDSDRPVRGVVAYTGIYDYRLTSGGLAGYVASLLEGTQEERPERWAEASPVSWIDGSEPPFLLIHGAADRSIPPEFSTGFASVLEAAGVPVELLLVEGADHMAVIRDTEAFEVVAAFVAGRLGDTAD